MKVETAFLYKSTLSRSTNQYPHLHYVHAARNYTAIHIYLASVFLYVSSLLISLLKQTDHMGCSGLEKILKRPAAHLTLRIWHAVGLHGSKNFLYVTSPKKTLCIGERRVQVGFCCTCHCAITWDYCLNNLTYYLHVIFYGITGT